MSWRTLARGLYGPAAVEHTVPPADVIPARRPVIDPAQADAIEQASRAEVALRLVEEVLLAETAKPTGHRNVDRYNLALEVRLALQPQPGTQVLHDSPAPPLRTAVNGSYRWYAQ
jgi:hypothetical protein